jgi:hypothetical protein
MTKNKVLKKIPCDNPKIDNEKLNNGKVYYTFIMCDKPIFSVELDHNGNVFNIEKHFNFEVKPNYFKIEKQLIKKFGTTTKVAKTKYSLKHKYLSGYEKELCWGDCPIHLDNRTNSDGYIIGINGDRKPYILVRYISTIEKKNGNVNNYLTIYFDDSKQRINNDKWMKKQNQLFKKQPNDEIISIDI